MRSRRMVALRRAPEVRSRIRVATPPRPTLSTPGGRYERTIHPGTFIYRGIVRRIGVRSLAVTRGDLVLGEATLRLPFPARVTSAAELRKMVVGLAQEARTKA